MPFGTDGEHVTLVDDGAVSINDGISFNAYAVGMEVHEGGNTVASTCGDDMDGCGHHGKYGVKFVQGNGVLRDEMLLTEAYSLAFGLQVTRFRYRKAEACRDGGTRQDAESVAEELKLRDGIVVDGGGDNLAQMIGLDKVEHELILDEPFVKHVDGGNESGTTGHFRGVKLENGEEAELMGTRLDGKFDGDGRLVAGFKFLEQRVEMVDGRELAPDFGTVTIGTVFCGDVACHDFFTENVAVTLNLLAFTGTRMAAVEYTRV